MAKATCLLARLAVSTVVNMSDTLDSCKCIHKMLTIPLNSSLNVHFWWLMICQGCPWLCYQRKANNSPKQPKPDIISNVFFPPLNKCFQYKIGFCWWYKRQTSLRLWSLLQAPLRVYGTNLWNSETSHLEDFLLLSKVCSEIGFMCFCFV